MSTKPEQLESKAADSGENPSRKLTLRIISFGYKNGKAPVTNALFDVRFLKNPFWVEDLRPLSGKDKAVQDYVIEQPAGRDFLESIEQLLLRLLPQLQDNNLSEFSIAFGCTGGQHRSTTMVELLARRLSESMPELQIEKFHRELDAKDSNRIEVQEEKQ